MQISVLDYLENSANKWPNKIAFADEDKEVTFLELKSQAQSIASELIKENNSIINQPIAVLLDKSVNSIIAFMGIVYSGNFYTPIDVNSPIQRIRKIIDVLQPAFIITDSMYKNLALQITDNSKIILFEENLDNAIDSEAITMIQSMKIDTDPLYTLFTSGSTGIPKGVTICHKSVLDYIEWVSEVFKINEDEIFGNQAPFFFDNSILDIYCTLKNGSTMYIIPESLFPYPIELIKYLNDKKINTIFWVPSALIYVANMKVLEKAKPIFLKKVLFCGEVMPSKQLNIWRNNVPYAIYANLYGPTEITDVCTYYIIDREFRDDELIPIGKPCRNTGILVINENNELVSDDEVGELCIRGTCLALGYYNDTERTKAVFVQNPLNTHYPEIIYRTGDLVKYNEFHELIYLGRKDFQIKHMGYRIEVGEIESVAMSIDDMENVCIIYDHKASKIVLFYQSKHLDDKTILNNLKKMIPKYMLPNRFVKIDEFPLNSNGKIDRLKLKEML